MRKLSMFVCANHTLLEDRTWDTTYEFHIMDDASSEEIDNWDGFATAERARQAGLKRLAELEARL
jgi:hypothetical protein